MLFLRKAPLVVLILSLLAGGCLIGPNFKEPSLPVASRWIESGENAVDTNREDYRDWWSVFNDPILNRLILEAYQQNLTLRTAGVRVLEARAQLGVAIGELYPQQQYLAAEVNYNRFPISLPFNFSQNTFWETQLGAQAAWELDFWGKFRRAVESADDSFLSQVAAYDNALVTLTGDVASDYIQIRTIQKQIAIAQLNIARQKDALKIARARFKYGTASKRDVYQAETVLGTTEASIPQLEIQLTSTKNALSVLLGIPPNPLDDVLGGSAEIPTTPETLRVGIPANLLRRRPDIRQAELTAAAQCAQIGYAKADLLPAFSLIGNVGLLATDIGNNNLGKVFNGNSLQYQAGPGVTWSILNYGQITNNVRVQDARFQELLITYQQTVLNAQQEVENGISGFILSREQAEYLREAVKAAEGALRIAILQYQQGIADFTTVIQAEQNLLSAQNSLAVATGNIALGLVATYRAVGGGWQIRLGNDFVPAATQHEMMNRTNWGSLLTPDLIRPKAPGLPSEKDRAFPVQPPEW